MNRIVEIAKRSQAYVDNYEANVVKIVESDPVSNPIIDLNREQLISHKDANGKALTHAETGKTTLSAAYGKRKGKSKPDLLDTGEFQDKMFLTMPGIDEYFISSKDYKTGFLAKNYGDIFGLALNSQKKTQPKVDKAIVDDWKNKVIIK